MKAYTWICNKCKNSIKDGDIFFIAYKGYMSGNTPCMHERLIMLHWDCSAIYNLKDRFYENIK